MKSKRCEAVNKENSIPCEELLPAEGKSALLVAHSSSFL